MEDVGSCRNYINIVKPKSSVSNMQQILRRKSIGGLFNKLSDSIRVPNAVQQTVLRQFADSFPHRIVSRSNQTLVECRP